MRTVKVIGRLLVIIGAATALALIYNHFNPNGIPLGIHGP